VAGLNGMPTGGGYPGVIPAQGLGKALQVRADVCVCVCVGVRTLLYALIAQIAFRQCVFVCVCAVMYCACNLRFCDLKCMCTRELSCQVVDAPKASIFISGTFSMCDMLASVLL